MEWVHAPHPRNEPRQEAVLCTAEKDMGLVGGGDDGLNLGGRIRSRIHLRRLLVPVDPHTGNDELTVFPAIWAAHSATTTRRNSSSAPAFPSTDCRDAERRRSQHGGESEDCQDKGKIARGQVQTAVAHRPSRVVALSRNRRGFAIGRPRNAPQGDRHEQQPDTKGCTQPNSTHAKDPIFRNTTQSGEARCPTNPATQPEAPHLSRPAGRTTSPRSHSRPLREHRLTL